MSAAAEAAKNAAAAAAATIPAGISPDFLMYMQMQEKKEARAEKIRLEDLARMEEARKEDRDRAKQERHNQQKVHEQQINLLYLLCPLLKLLLFLAQLILVCYSHSRQLLHRINICTLIT